MIVLSVQLQQLYRNGQVLVSKSIDNRRANTLKNGKQEKYEGEDFLEGGKDIDYRQSQYCPVGPIIKLCSK